MTIPKISVLMGVYNPDITLLSIAINSILKQTFKNFEFIIVNDGSNKKTSECLLNYKKIDKRIKLLSIKNNIGLTKALNYGIARCIGEFIARQDADDISDKNRLDIQYSFLTNNPVFDAVATNVNLISFNGTIHKHTDITNQVDLLKKKNIYIHGSMMFKKKSIINVGGYNEEMIFAQDYDLYLRMVFCHNMRIGLEKNYLYYLRQHSGSISNTRIFAQFFFATKAKVNIKSKNKLYSLINLYLTLIKDFVFINHFFVGYFLKKSLTLLIKKQ